LRDQNLPVTLATFTFLLRRAGRPIQDVAVDAACGAFEAGARTPTELGADLVAAVGVHLGGDEPKHVAAALDAILGAGASRTDLGEGADREARLGAIRRTHFGNPLPWLAQLVERTPDGRLVVRWVLVEGFDEVARVMDPNPWDDKDEERTLPINDFLVLWELTGCASVRV
jgi:hypothetical protein